MTIATKCSRDESLFKSDGMPHTTFGHSVDDHFNEMTQFIRGRGMVLTFLAPTT